MELVDATAIEPTTHVPPSQALVEAPWIGLTPEDVELLLASVDLDLPLVEDPTLSDATSKAPDEEGPNPLDDDDIIIQSLERSKRYASERRSRLRRLSNRKRMEEQLSTLEFVVEQMPSLQAAVAGDPIDDGGDTHGARRLRAHVLRTVELARQIRELEAHGTQLRRRVREHELAEKMLRSWFLAPPKDPWALNVECWNALTHAAYEPRTLAQCTQVIRATLEQIHDPAFSRNFISSGYDFMGWSDRRKLDPPSATFQFSFSKSFGNCDAKWLFDEYWAMHFSAETLCEKMLGRSNRLHVELLQRISEDIFIFRNDVQYPGMTGALHTVYVMFRLRTPRGGFLHCIQSIPAPAVHRALADGDGWMDNFYWTTMDPIATASQPTGCQVAFHGRLTSTDRDFLMRWMMEMVMTLVRAESAFLGPLSLRWGG